MIKIQGTIPQQVGVAVSGGVDSMCALDFLRRRHAVTAYYFDHGTGYGMEAGKLVRGYCADHNVPLRYGVISQVERPAGKSWEEHWRDERYAYLSAQPDEIVLAHHLDDAVETYVFNLCHGTPQTMPYRAGLAHNCFRPFLLNRKAEFLNWAERHGVPWLEDPTNGSEKTDFNRARIRNRILPEILAVNPGLHKVVKKLLLNTI